MSRLTDKVVASLTCPPGKKDVLVFDAELKGFGLRRAGCGHFSFNIAAPGPSGGYRSAHSVPR
jgi:hypothetical protein